MSRLWSPAASRICPWTGNNFLGGGTLQTRRRPYSVTAIGSSRISGRADELKTDASIEITDQEEPSVRRMRVEAILLLAKTPINPRKLAQLAHLADATEARTLVRQLNRVYDTHGRAIRVEQIAGGYRMLTHPTLAPWLARLGHLPPAVRLSTPMMETLAVVAYRQPVSRASAEAIRGVACGELLRQLMERDLIRIAGRSEELGRPYLYGTTKRFLQLFGLSNVDALPPIHWQTLQDDDPPVSPLDDLSTSTKEPVVSTMIASVFDPNTLGQPILSHTEIMPTLTADPNVVGFAVVPTLDAELDRSVIDPFTNGPLPVAAIDDDEDGVEEDDDWDDDDDEDDDWDDDDDDEDDDDEDEDDEDEDEEELEDDWEEVADEDDDEDDDEEEDGDEDDAEDEDDDEDWSEDEEEGAVEEEEEEEVAGDDDKWD